mgnify:CR=1|jgi:hypothetical protein|tara:strand:+ start:81 stop:299 length:219 start_codon:yes stop_codon:yes gene_type:complete
MYFNIFVVVDSITQLSIYPDYIEKDVILVFLCFVIDISPQCNANIIVSLQKHVHWRVASNIEFVFFVEKLFD